MRSNAKGVVGKEDTISIETEYIELFRKVIKVYTTSGYRQASPIYANPGELYVVLVDDSIGRPFIVKWNMVQKIKVLAIEDSIIKEAERILKEGK